MHPNVRKLTSQKTALKKVKKSVGKATQRATLSNIGSCIKFHSARNLPVKTDKPKNRKTKDMKKIPKLTTTACFTILALATASTSMAATLVNGGFEAEPAPGAPTGWTVAGPAGSALTSDAYARSGNQSLVIDSTGAGAWSSPNVSQTFAAAPGDEFNFQGWMLRSASIADASFGILKIEFRNIADGTITVDAANIATGVFAFGGVESRPVLNDTNALVDTWLFTEAQAIAPADTVSVGFFVINVNQGAAPGPMYFDDISVTLIPEPSALALTGLGLACLVGRRRRK